MTVVNKDAAAVGSFDWVRTQVDFQLNGLNNHVGYTYVRDVFPDRVIISQESYEGGGNVFEIPYTIDGSTLVLDAEAATDVKVEYVPKSGSPVLTGPIVMKSEDDRRLAYAAVLVPGEPDSDGDVVTAEKVEEVAHKWLEEYRNIDLMHTLSPANATVVESYVTPAEMTVGDYTLPQGTWVMGSRILDDEVWSAVKDGKLTGYSIMGVRKAAFKSAGATPEAAFKRTLLSDLGDDWVCPFVSIVDAPAVPKAKFFALKSEGAATEDGVMTRLAKALGFAPDEPAQSIKVGRKFSDKTYTRLKDGLVALQELIEEAEKERDTGDKAKKSEEESKEGNDMTPEELTTAISAAVAPLVERLDKLETKPEAAAEEKPAEEAEKSAPASEELTELKQTVEQQGELLEAIGKRLGSLAPATKSRALKGQDTDADKPEAAEKAEDDDGRDVFGRSRKKTYNIR